MKIIIHNIEARDGLEYITFTSDKNSMGINKPFTISETTNERLKKIKMFLDINFPELKSVETGIFTYTETIPEPVVETPLEKTSEQINRENAEKVIINKKQEITEINNKLSELIKGLKEDKEVLEIAEFTGDSTKVNAKSERVTEKFTEYSTLYPTLQTKKSELKTLEDQFKIDFPTSDLPIR